MILAQVAVAVSVAGSVLTGPAPYATLIKPTATVSGVVIASDPKWTSGHRIMDTEFRGDGSFGSVGVEFKGPGDINSITLNHVRFESLYWAIKRTDTPQVWRLMLSDVVFYKCRFVQLGYGSPLNVWRDVLWQGANAYPDNTDPIVTSVGTGLLFDNVGFEWGAGSIAWGLGGGAIEGNCRVEGWKPNGKPLFILNDGTNVSFTRLRLSRPTLKPGEKWTLFRMDSKSSAYVQWLDLGFEKSLLSDESQAWLKSNVSRLTSKETL